MRYFDLIVAHFTGGSKLEMVNTAMMVLFEKLQDTNNK